MRKIFGSKNLKIENSAVALGNFDALHKGHIAIISDMLSFAKAHKLVSVVYMFKDSPNKGELGINSLDKRLEILEEIGVNIVVVEEFSDIKNTPYDEFVEEYIKKRMDAKAVFVGFNYRFGKGAEGNAKILKELCRKNSVDVFIKDCVEIDGETVSSSNIKDFITEGEMEKTREFMTRGFLVSGIVIKGKQLGRTIGFPTANIEYPKGVVLPKEGVYITLCKIGENKYYSITNVGEKPTVSDERKNIETAIGDFDGDIYGEQIEIEFCKRIRDIIRFDSLDKLKDQLFIDMNMAKTFFDTEKNNIDLL